MPSIRTKLRTKRPTLLVSITQDDGTPSHEFHTALLDTGQEKSTVSQTILDALQATSPDTTFALHFPLRGDDNDPDETIAFHSLTQITLEPDSSDSHKADIVIGMDIIQQNTLIISGDQLIFNF